MLLVLFFLESGLENPAVLSSSKHLYAKESEYMIFATGNRPD
jgi:hypothetical protein